MYSGVKKKTEINFGTSNTCAACSNVLASIAKKMIIKKKLKLTFLEGRRMSKKKNVMKEKYVCIIRAQSEPYRMGEIFV